jgi:thymidylate kinase
VIGLELGYAGSLRLGAHRRLIAWLVPDPDLSFYLRLPADAAKARKDDIFATEVLERHIQRYERLSTHLDAVITLDGVDEAEAIAQRVLAAVLASPECARGA